MKIFALDAGNEQSGWVSYDSEEHKIISCGIDDNLTVRGIASTHIAIDIFAYEWIGYMGMAVGATIFETCREIGRIIQAYGDDSKVYPIMRREVKITLCGSMKAKDKNIRQAIIDRFPATGGGKVPQIGTKKEPGPLYGVKSHIWSALAIALTYVDMEKF